jgi:hypothetical protein
MEVRRRERDSATLNGDGHVPADLKFVVTSSLGKRITASVAYWQKIVETKHPIMRNREELVKQTLTSPESIRRSKKDLAVYLYYRRHEGRFCCVVAKHLNGEGFVVTTYLTDKIKAGEVVA